MLVNDYMGNDFLKAADLGLATPTIQIAKVEPVEFGGGEKPKLVIHPVDPNCKPVVLNVTNTKALAAVFGPESMAWIGQSVMLSVRQTQMGPGIAVTPLQPQAGTLPAFNPTQQAPLPGMGLPPLSAPAVSVPAQAALPPLPTPGLGFPPQAPQAPAVQPGPPAAAAGQVPDLPGQPGVPFDDDIPFE